MRSTALALTVLIAGAAGCSKPAPVAATPPPPEPPADLQPRCVYFKDLRAFLPATLPGFEQVRDEGSTGKYGDVQVSEAKRTFAQGEGRELSVRIVDTTMAQDLGRAIRSAAQDAASRPPSDPTAPIFLQGAVGFVRFDGSRDSAETRAEATLWVADRFVVAVSSQGFDDTAQVRQVARQLDLAGLSNLRLDGGRRVP
ncbi:MAG TPA: hypothetical protein VH208_10635 [Myxococcaceae bacterium]|nr:hypothetical protein [Myxococcaceae bacterium]